MNVDINMPKVGSQLKPSKVGTRKGGCSVHTRGRGAEGTQFDLTNVDSIICRSVSCTYCYLSLQG